MIGYKVVSFWKVEVQRPQKQPIFYGIVISLLVWANLCGLSLSLNVTEASQGDSFVLTSSGEPLHDRKIYLASLPLRSSHEGDDILAQYGNGIHLERVLTRSSGSGKGVLYCHRYEPLSKNREISFSTDSRSTGFKLANRQSCQRLDIPPPRPLARLPI